MNASLVRATLLVLAIFALLSISILAQRPAAPADTTARIVAAAQAVSTSLDAAGRAKLQFDFDSPQKSSGRISRTASTRATAFAWAISPRRNVMR